MGPEEDPTSVPSDTEEPTLVNGEAGHDGLPEENEDDKSSSESESEDEDEDEEEEEDEEVARKNARRKFDRIISDLKDGRLVLDDRAKVRDFIATRMQSDHLGKRSNHKGQNLLHMLADTGKDELPSRKIKYLVEALVTMRWAAAGEAGDLLAQQDTDGKTPLHCAIDLKHHRLAKIMVVSHSDIDRIIRTESKRTNCLHLALRNRTSTSGDELLMSLIEKSSAATLTATDDNGLTPLHLAVDYARCDDAELAIVKAIVKKCPSTMDMTYEHKERGLLSPYRYHELRHTEEEKAAQESAKTKREADQAATGSAESVLHAKASQRKGDGVLKEERPLRQTVANPLDKDKKTKMPTYDAPKGKYGTAAPTRSSTLDGPLQPKPKTEGKQDPGAKEDDSTPKHKEKRKRAEKKDTKTRSSKIRPTQESAAKIKEFLKLYCLRHKKHDEAVEFLYGVQQDRQIYFDIFGSGPTLSQNRIQDGLKHVQFEDVLQYVAVPQVQIEGKPPVTKGNKAPPKPDSKGRTDYQLLFDWLKEKHVKKIIKVIVEDLEEPSHHDEAIEDCVDGMDVEIWDWRKLDISPDIIKTKAPNVREVNLYWSGNSVVLRGWSEIDGLRQLKKLKTIVLHPRQGLETRKRHLANLAAFTERIQADADLPERSKGETIKVMVAKGSGSARGSAAAGTDTAREDPFERHRWITTMEEFADFLIVAQKAADPPVELVKPVLVALIDDGVDINDQTIQSRVMAGRSFCHRSEPDNLNQGYYISSGGHGTAMAGFICKLCPDVQLYVLKLDEYYPDGKRTITARSAAKAVRAAVDKGVDIISMSWTIEKTDTNKADIEALEKAIELAASRNIIMFCAATDQGAYKDRSWPAATGTKKIFKIGAAEASGALNKWVGDPSAVDYFMPGHQVVMERQDDRLVARFTPYTGSSVATALASGLAALILYCVQLGGIFRADENQKLKDKALTEYQKLKRHDRMKTAFDKIGLAKASDGKFIEVWNYFGSNAFLKKRESDPEFALKDRWLEIVAEIGDELKKTTMDF